MSEAVLTNLIIGLVGIVGVVGSLYATYVQRKTLTDTTKMQLEFELQKIIMTNKIKEIKKWIDPLRTSLTDYSNLINVLYDGISYFQEYTEDFSTFRDVYDDGIYRELNETSGTLEVSRKELSNNIAQISDSYLGAMIDELIKIPIYVSTSQIVENQKLVEVVNRTERAKILVSKAFFRIEELLSGNFEIKGKL